MEADAADVVLAAGVRAAAHVDAHLAAWSGPRCSSRSRCSEMARLRPIEQVMPSLQESVPGHETTSVISWRRPRAVRARRGPSRPRRALPSGIQRSTKFWLTEVRARPLPYVRMMSARPRNCSGDRSPCGTFTSTVRVAGLALLADVRGARQASNALAVGAGLLGFAGSARRRVRLLVVEEEQLVRRMSLLRPRLRELLLDHRVGTLPRRRGVRGTSDAPWRGSSAARRPR